MQDKIPGLSRKSAKIKQFLKEYCHRGTEPVNSTESKKKLQRQMVDVDKMIEDQVIEADRENNEEPDQFKERISRQVKSILDARLFGETE